MNAATVDQAFRAAWKRLESAGIDTARLDARLLVGRVLGGGAEKVLSEGARALSATEAAQLETLVNRRANREPMSHILGAREFWSLDFKVTSATLTPRPDTEILIETALDLASRPVRRVLDLGTGTGCILLALLSEWPDARGVGVDASGDALAVARHNAETLGLAARARFAAADWRDEDSLATLGGPFDVVVSNPPYIPAGDIAALEADVRDYEPRAALDGGADGLDAYRAIIARLDGLLAPAGLAVFEVGAGQASDVAALLSDAGFAVAERRRDLGGIERVVAARREKSPNEKKELE